MGSKQRLPFTEHVHTVSTGTAVPHISGRDICAFEFDLPPLPEQRAIAATLGALDDKIELNRRMGATLEGMARALYRSWFVDFDPVHAKMRGEAPAHMDPATAALFPDRLGEGGLPEGWGITPFTEVSKQVKETVKPQERPEETFAHFSLPAFDKGDGPQIEPGSAIKSNKQHVPDDAILFSRLNPTIPRVWWAKTGSASGATVASTEFYVASARSPAELPWLYATMSSEAFRDAAKARVTGTSNSHQRVNAKALAAVEVVRPSHEIVVAFGRLTDPFFAQIHANEAQSCTLAALRDALLPRLMSGELRVPEAEEAVAAAS